MLTTALAAPAYAEKRVALVIGNNDYRNMPQLQVAALPVQPLPPIYESSNAPIASFLHHNGGWSVAVSIADPTLGISWRFGESGEFKETGFLDSLDPRTRRRIPNPSVELPNDAPAATIQIRYIDPTGQMQGPFPIKFDPRAALIASDRKLLERSHVF